MEDPHPAKAPPAAFFAWLAAAFFAAAALGTTRGVTAGAGWDTALIAAVLTLVFCRRFFATTMKGVDVGRGDRAALGDRFAERRIARCYEKLISK